MEKEQTAQGGLVAGGKGTLPGFRIASCALTIAKEQQGARMGVLENVARNIVGVVKWMRGS